MAEYVLKEIIGYALKGIMLAPLAGALFYATTHASGLFRDIKKNSLEKRLIKTSAMVD